MAVVLVFTTLSNGGSGASRPGSQGRSHTIRRAVGRRPSSYATGLRVLRFLDTSRSIVLDGRRQPRMLLTEVRYPALGPPSETDVRHAPAARVNGPFPLVVFGHGFDVAPARYARMLQSWAHSGYVVAAPTFPGENPAAPGGPNESDLVNEPADMRFVISRMLSLSAGSGPFAGLIDPSHIAVAGHSDGGDTALAVAYDPRFRDARVRAAIVLSGAEIPAEGEFAFPTDGPPLLATQGTADTVNPPSATNAFFEAASSPKYLLSLIDAEHLPPYTEQSQQLEIVERATRAFLDAYLAHEAGALARLRTDSNTLGKASLHSNPR
ncbi:MAG: alpha/beta hydrolase family protein [Solirubrobacteraceae bacterium]